MQRVCQRVQTPFFLPNLGYLDNQCTISYALVIKHRNERNVHVSLFCYDHNTTTKFSTLHINTQKNTLNCDAQTNNTAASIQCLSHFNVIMLSAVKLNVIIPSVVGPNLRLYNTISPTNLRKHYNVKSQPSIANIMGPRGQPYPSCGPKFSARN